MGDYAYELGGRVSHTFDYKHEIASQGSRDRHAALAMTEGTDKENEKT